MVAKHKGIDRNVILSVKNAKPWSPSSPFKIELLGEDGTVLDNVTFYAGFRSVGKATDEKW
tara:strand:- start:65559 stop:65741 length:183 start_codon:yes stop_codon:yes gene_type:complete